MYQNSKRELEPRKLVYTVAEIAAILCVSTRTAYNLCNKQENFKVVKLGGKSIRVIKTSFDEWFEAQ